MNALRLQESPPLKHALPAIMGHRRVLGIQKAVAGILGIQADALPFSCVGLLMLLRGREYLDAGVAVPILIFLIALNMKGKLVHLPDKQWNVLQEDLKTIVGNI